MVINKAIGLEEEGDVALAALEKEVKRKRSSLMESD